MATLNLATLRKLAAFGTGAGIEIGPRHLRLVLAKVRPGGAALTGACVIEDFRERPAAEWGAEYARFLAAHQGAHLAGLAVLPRELVILRSLALPGVTDADAPAAIAFQLDSLHPYGAGEVMFDARRIGRTAWFQVALAEQGMIAALAARFAEAGVKLAGFTVSASAIHPARRLFGPPEQDACLGVAETPDGAIEIYGESASRPVFSATFDGGDVQATRVAAAELRLDAEIAPVPLAALLPQPRRIPESEDPVALGAAWAAALAAACPHLQPVLNLLPAPQRGTTSRVKYIPTLALAALLVLLGAGLAVQGAWNDHAYLSLLAAEIRKAEPAAKAVEAASRETDRTLARIALLEGFRARSKDDLDLLAELTNRLPPPVFLSHVELTRTTLSLAGEAPQAEGLLKLLDESPLIEKSEFTTPFSRAGQNEVFRIRAARQGVAP